MSRPVMAGRPVFSGPGQGFTNYRFPDAQIGNRRRPISETPPPAPGGYTPQVMMVM